METCCRLLAVSPVTAYNGIGLTAKGEQLLHLRFRSIHFFSSYCTALTILLTLYETRFIIFGSLLLRVFHEFQHLLNTIAILFFHNISLVYINAVQHSKNFNFNFNFGSTISLSPGLSS